MSCFRAFLIFLLATVSTGTSFAHGENLNSTDRVVYDTIYQMCSSPDSMDFLRVYSDGALSLLDEKKLVQNRGLSEALAGYLNSYGYYIALRDCFPKDEGARNRFTQILIAEDLTGKIGGAVVTIYIGGKWLGGLLGRTLQSFGVSTGGLKIAAIATTASAAALVVTVETIEWLHTHKRFQLAKELANSTSSSLEAQLAGGRQERDLLQSMLAKTDDPKVRELIQKNLDVISKSEATLLNSKERLQRILGASSL